MIKHKVHLQELLVLHYLNYLQIITYSFKCTNVLEYKCQAPQKNKTSPSIEALN